MFYFLTAPIMTYSVVLIASAVIPMLLHGAYDYIATLEEQQGGWYFLAFVAVLFAASYILISKTAKKDKPI
jgi:NADH:ubiquinone oxidoreductase subunit H